MYVAFPEEMRKIDETAIDDGIPSILLMEHAARSVATLVRELGKDPICVLCGTGNNGGDGYALARLLSNSGLHAFVISIGEPKTGDASLNRKLFLEIPGECLAINELTEEKLGKLLDGSAVIVDALFGTGFSGSIEGKTARLIEKCNELDRTRISVDIPSGVDGSNGFVEGTAFRADFTVTFGVPKVGHFFFPGRRYAGRLIVEDWGFPHKHIEEVSSVKLLTDKTARRLLPHRPPNSHKGTFGATLVVGGSELYGGAPVLTARGALVVGAGLVHCLAPREVMRQVRYSHPEVIAFCPERDIGHLSPDDLKLIEGILHRIDVVIVGPGIGRHPDTGEFVKRLVAAATSSRKTVIVDADGLYHYSVSQKCLKGMPGVLLTPHPGELSTLTGLSVTEVRANIPLFREFVKERKLALLVKDSTSTFVSDEGDTWLSCFGNSGLAKGGSGDLLSGAIGGFAAQTGDVARSVLLGTYFLGKAAELIDHSEAFMQPGEVAAGFDKVFKNLHSLNDVAGEK